MTTRMCRLSFQVFALESSLHIHQTVSAVLSFLLFFQRQKNKKIKAPPLLGLALSSSPFGCGLALTFPFGGAWPYHTPLTGQAWPSPPAFFLAGPPISFRTGECLNKLKILENFLCAHRNRLPCRLTAQHTTPHHPRPDTHTHLFCAPAAEERIVSIDRKWLRTGFSRLFSGDHIC